MSFADEIEKISKEDIQLFSKQHEELSKQRIVAFQKRLDAMAESDAGAGTVLKDRLELQTKIEELIVKSREAEHAAWKVHGPIVISIAAIVVSLLTGLFAAAFNTLFKTFYHQ